MDYIQGLLQFDFVILSHIWGNCIQIDNTDILTIFFILGKSLNLVSRSNLSK